MSWVDQIETGILITTGDGKSYEPLYFNSPRSFDFNIAEFDFPHVEGTLVKRGQKKGTKYTLEFFFQGEEQLATALEFEQSSKDTRPWVISHPMHGTMSMQPVSLTFDNTGLNTSKITASLIETITDDAPKVTADAKEQILKSVENFSDTVTTVSGESMTAPDTDDITGLTLEMLGIYDEAAPEVKSSIQANEYFNLFNKANGLLLDLIAEPTLALIAMNDVIMYPSLFELSVKQRIEIFINQFTNLGDALEELITPSEKNNYQFTATALISGMVNSIVTPLDDNDYGNAVDVLDVIDSLVTTYNELVTNLDTLQTDNGGDPDSFIPNYDINQALSSLVNYTVANLFQIALGAAQERIVYLEQDSNLILLTHRFYGLELNDETIDEFIRNNKIGLSEMLQIKKGRQIKYYV